MSESAGKNLTTKEEDAVQIGPRVIGQERWERMKKAGFGLYKNIAAEGVLLPPPASRAA
jgi:hypothetical protein